MKKRKILNVLLFGLFAFLSCYNVVFAEGNCILGTETTKDVKGILNIFQIVAPLIMLAYTILDAIKAVNSGGSFHFSDGGDMTGQKVVSRFVKRLIGVLLLFILPTLINILFIWAGIWDENGGCDFGGSNGGSGSTNPDAYGCYEYKICDAGCGNGYRWGTAADNEGNTKVDNTKCGRDSFGNKEQCYACNHDGSIMKWKGNSGSDADCQSGYHVTNESKDRCK